MECQTDAGVLTFYYFFTHWFFIGGGVNNVIYVTEGAREGVYGCTRGPVWVHVTDDIVSRERAVMGLESQAVSVWIR